MKVWRCPRCAHSVKANAVAVSHRCTAHRLQWVDFKPVEEVIQSTGAHVA